MSRLNVEADPTKVVDPETRSETSLDRPWNVIVWNDPITLMSYVVYVFQKLFGFTRERATQLMLWEGLRVAFIVLVVIPVVVSALFLTYTATVEVYCFLRERWDRRSSGGRSSY